MSFSVIQIYKKNIGDNFAELHNIRELNARELSDVTNVTKMVGKEPRIWARTLPTQLFHDLITNLVESEKFQEERNYLSKNLLIRF